MALGSAESEHPITNSELFSKNSTHVITINRRYRQTTYHKTALAALCSIARKKGQTKPVVYAQKRKTFAHIHGRFFSLLCSAPWKITALQ